MIDPTAKKQPRGHRLPTIFFVLIIFYTSGLRAETIDISTLKTNLHRFSALTGHFEQENFDTLQDRRTAASGRFFFLKPGLMRWEYLKPDPYSIIVGRKYIWIYDPTLENVTIHNTQKVRGIKILAMMFEPEKLRQHFRSIKPTRVFLDHQPGDTTLFLGYLQPDPTVSEIQICFNSGFEIKQFIVVDTNRNYRKLILSDLNSGSGPVPSDFEFKIPEGVEIIDKTKE